VTGARSTFMEILEVFPEAAFLSVYWSLALFFLRAAVCHCCSWPCGTFGQLIDVIAPVALTLITMIVGAIGVAIGEHVSPLDDFRQAVQLALAFLYGAVAVVVLVSAWRARELLDKEVQATSGTELAPVTREVTVASPRKLTRVEEESDQEEDVEEEEDDEPLRSIDGDRSGDHITRSHSIPVALMAEAERSALRDVLNDVAMLPSLTHVAAARTLQRSGDEDQYYLGPADPLLSPDRHLLPAASSASPSIVRTATPSKRPTPTAAASRTPKHRSGMSKASVLSGTSSLLYSERSSSIASSDEGHVRGNPSLSPYRSGAEEQRQTTLRRQLDATNRSLTLLSITLTLVLLVRAAWAACLAAGAVPAKEGVPVLFSSDSSLYDAIVFSTTELIPIVLFFCLSKPRSSHATSPGAPEAGVYGAMHRPGQSFVVLQATQGSRFADSHPRDKYLDFKNHTQDPGECVTETPASWLDGSGRLTDRLNLVSPASPLDEREVIPSRSVRGVEVTDPSVRQMQFHE
jgi:hypothetical protein